MQVFDLDGARIAAQIDGSGDDAVVLIHGFPLSHAIWNRQVEMLSGAHRTIAIDLRGMGESSVARGPYLMESLAGDVAGVLDALGLDRVTLVGHSLGGYVGLAFARMYAERVNRLALVCSRIDGDDRERIRGRNELAQRAEERGSSEVFSGDMFTAMFGMKFQREHPEIIEKIRKIAQNSDPAALAAMQRGMALREGSYDIAPELRMPVLMVAGGDDRLLSVGEAEAMAQAFPAGRLAVLKASGHLPMIEEPDSLGRLLADFSAG